MMKLGIIGIGDIAKKAYLPVISKLANVEMHVFTRNTEVLREISNQYRYPNTHSSLTSIIESGIKGAFVHSSTESHENIVRELLQNGIHVYVDKPITYHLETTKELVELAENKGLILMTGFNRRFAPFYRTMAEVDEPTMIIMQKNRHALPGTIRAFVYDDFIHVLDTVRYVFKDEIEDITVHGRVMNGLLYHVVVQLISKATTGLAIMNRDSGAVEEKLEVMGPKEKRVVHDLDQLTILRDQEVIVKSFANWDSTLYKRGFEQIVAEFIDAITTNQFPSITARDSLRTHEICEHIVEQLERLV
ncbi:Gfo/Idh/MocA family oxidoreductase [Neobacillus sp. DY30]|uniref:Gfo/Idh/MocA family protein n=1 Tax=Neobacillus sp. DY30 TaxID=3047871 RepID=UPI0024BF9ED7|nr:Gfo/Idh/MocA family oxidoreductase [Neobacillus sp. DY30]WHX98276.1 Gfo/Idh/MocA family oxidoreductase [Neobacillus sp. DY30]